ncbi:MAG: rod shape-determining protein MreC [Caulobacteraceae bacterium]
MSLREGPLGDIRVPLTWSAAAALVIGAIIAAALLLSHPKGQARVGLFDQARHAVDQAAGPVSGALSAPLRWAGDASDTVRGYFFAVSENRRLRAELVQAQGWRDQLAASQFDNQRLRAVLGIRTDPPLPHVAATTIADSRGPFANTRLADAGSDKGVTEGNPVVSEHGLVGRVVGVTPRVSRILLLTDAESHTPVILVRTNGRAVLAGDGSGSPKLDYVRSAQPIREGDRVLTSGDGGVYPRGLPVGTVVRGFDGGWRVALDSDAAPIDYVQILLFTDFSQLVNEKALAPKVLPTAMTEEPSQAIVGAAALAGAKAATAPAGKIKPAAAKSDKTAADKAKSAEAKSAGTKKSAGAKSDKAPKPKAEAAKPASVHKRPPAHEPAVQPDAEPPL